MYRRWFARTFMAVRECFVQPRRRDTQEEIIADLHTCIEQLEARIEEMEGRIQHCKDQALYHMRLSKREVTVAASARETRRARFFMEDRARIQAELDKAQRMMHMLQGQVDSIVSSNVDMLIVDTMRGFNATAARLRMPQRTNEIEHLGDELGDRHSEICALQEALSSIASVGHGVGATAAGSEEEENLLLMHELEALLANDEADRRPSSFAPPRAQAGAREKRHATTTTATTTTSSMLDMDAAGKKKKEEEEEEEEEEAPSKGDEAESERPAMALA